MDRGETTQDRPASPNLIVLPGGSRPEEMGWRERGRAFRGMLWCEWFAHSRVVLFFIALWLLCVWFVPLAGHPGWILLLGVVYAIVAGPLFGGSDLIAGCEEFSFALPLTRGQMYLTRLVLGGGLLLILSALNLLALGIELPQVLARFYIRAGLIEARPLLPTTWLYGLVVAVPWSLFAGSFVISALTHSRMMVLCSWFWAGVPVLILLQFGLWYERFVWEAMNGFFTLPVLFTSSFAALAAGYRQYRRKEVGPYMVPLQISARWWLWGLLFMAGIILAMVLLTSLVQYFRYLLGTTPH